MVTLTQAARAVERLVREGMALRHAVNLTAGTYGYTPDELYRALELINK